MIKTMTIANKIKNKIRSSNNLICKIVVLLYKLIKFIVESSHYIFSKRMFYRYFKPNINQISIEITTTCNLHCFNCGRACSQAQSNEFMSIKQIESFIDESIQLKWNWKMIALLGGEPTLHPDFFKILNIIKRYKAFKPDCKVLLVTNGYGKKVNKVLSKLPSWVSVKNSAKTSKINKFTSRDIAPIDLEEYKNSDFSSGCWITQECGLGLTRYGIYACGAGASIDRVLGLNIGIKGLSDVDQKALKKQLKKFCRYCGHYKTSNPFSSRLKDHRITKPLMSDFWKKAYTRYKRKKPKLSIYNKKI